VPSRAWLIGSNKDPTVSSLSDADWLEFFTFVQHVLGLKGTNVTKDILPTSIKLIDSLIYVRPDVLLPSTSLAAEGLERSHRKLSERLKLVLELCESLGSKVYEYFSSLVEAQLNLLQSNRWTFDVDESFSASGTSNAFYGPMLSNSLLVVLVLRVSVPSRQGLDTLRSHASRWALGPVYQASRTCFAGLINERLQPH